MLMDNRLKLTFRSILSFFRAAISKLQMMFSGQYSSAVASILGAVCNIFLSCVSKRRGIIVASCERVLFCCGVVYSLSPPEVSSASFFATSLNHTSFITAIYLLNIVDSVGYIILMEYRLKLTFRGVCPLFLRAATSKLLMKFSGQYSSAVSRMLGAVCNIFLSCV